MRIVRIPFSRTLLRSGKVSKDLMLSVVNALPDGSNIVGFGNSSSEFMDYIFVESNTFKEVSESSMPPDCQVHLICNSGVTKVDRIDFSNAIEQCFTGVVGMTTLKIPKCNHNWKLYSGIMDTFEYCTICNEKK